MDALKKTETCNIRDRKIFRILLFTFLFTALICHQASSQCTIAGVSGSGFLFASQCAPVTTVIYYEFTFSSLVAPPLTTYNVVYDWGDGVTETVPMTVQTRVVPPGITTYYVRAEVSHGFPPDGLCEYQVRMVLLDGIYECSDSRQIQVVGNWHQDDIATANGFIELDPERENVCEGLPLADFRFEDASNYACNLQDNPLAQKPNHTARWEQFVYGTNPVTGQGIPNLFIRVGTAQTVVWLTDNDGEPISGPWNVDPVTGATVADYNTVSGYFEGPVVQIPVNPVTGEYALNDTYPISFDGVGTVVDDRFQVTVRNWNICNAWTGSNYDDANPDFSHIWIVDGPLANAGPDGVVCEGAAYNMNGILVEGNSASWGTTGDGSFTNTDSPDGANYTAGPNDILNGGVDLVLSAFGTGQCPVHTDTMRLSFDPLPDIPVIDISAGTNGFCDDNTRSLTLRSTVSPNGNYEWFYNGTSIGNNARTLTLNDYTQSGNYTVMVYGNTPNACPGLSAPFTVNIYQLATTTDPVDVTVCQGIAASFSVTPGGAASSVQWERSSNGGISWVDITGGTAPNDGCTYSGYNTSALDIASPAFAMNGYLYRARLTTTSGGCITYSAAATITVNPAATITAQPQDAQVCELDNTSFSVTATIPPSSEITGYQWQRRRTSGTFSDITSSTDGGIYSDFTTPTLEINNVSTGISNYRYRVVITTTGGCTITSDYATITVNRLADITGQPANRAICAGSGTTFTVTDDGNPSVTDHQWQISTDGGVVWNDLPDGGIYSGATSGTLTLTNVTVDYNTYRYRCRLTTNGPCDIYSNDGLLTVHPLPLDRNVVAADPWLCYNTATSINLIASENSVVYQLRVNTTNTGTSQTGNGSDLAFPTGNLQNTTTFNAYAARTTTIGASTLTCYLQMTNEPMVNVNPNITMPDLTHPDICIDGVIDLPSADATGGTNIFEYSWSGSEGFTGSMENPGSFSPAATGTHLYNVVVTDQGFRQASTDNTACSVSDNITFNVNPLPAINMSVSDPVICEGQTASIQLANSVLGTRYQLRLDSDDTYIGSAVNGTGSAIVFPVTPSATTDYNVLATVISTGCVSEVTDRATVTVNPNPDPAISGPDNVCQYASVNYSTAGLTGHTYQWSTTLGTISSLITANPVTIQWNTAGSGTVTVMETITSTGCSATTPAYPVTVNPGPPTERATVVSGATNICLGGDLNLDVTNVSTAVEYIWDFSWVAGTSNAVTTSSQILIDLDGLDPGTYSVNVAGANGCGTGPWMITPHSFNINDIPDLSPLGNSVCSDEASAITLSITNPGPTITSLTYNIVSINYGGLTASAGNQATGSGKPAGEIADDAYTNKTAGDVNVVYAVVPVSLQGCSGNQENVILTVSPEPVLASLSTSRCSEEALGFNLSVSTGSSAAASYNITSINSNGLTASAGSPSAGNTLPAGVIADDAWINTTSSAVSVVYSIVPVGANGCTGDTYTMTITVNPEPVFAQQSLTRCSDEALGVNLGVISGSAAAATYNITSINSGGLTASAGSPSTGNGLAAGVISNDAWTNTTGAQVNIIYTVVPVSSEGCQGNPGTVTVTVNPEPVPETHDIALCSDEVPGLSLGTAMGSVGAAWYNITAINNGGLGFSAGNPATGTNLPAGVISDDAWTNMTANPVDVIYTVVPVSADGCLGNSAPITITVNPEPVMSPSTVVRCSDEAAGVSLNVSAGGVAAASYSITAIENGGLTASAGSPAAGSGLAAGVIADDAWSNTTSASVNVVYTVVPMSAGGCEGDAVDITVTVKPEPVITAGQSASACSGNALDYEITLDNFTNTADNVTFTWPAPVLDPVSIYFTGGNARTVPSMVNIDDIFINTLGSLGTAIYTVIPYKDGCAGTPVDVTVNVGSEPVLDPDLDRDICSNTATGLVLQEAAGSVTATYYIIQSITRDAGLVALSGNAVAPNNNAPATCFSNDRFENTTGYDLTVTYRVVPVLAPDCIGDPADIVITVHPQPVVIAGQVKSVCSGTAEEMEILLFPANLPDGTVFNWNAPSMSAGSPQGTAGVDVPAGNAGTIHLNDVIYNYSSAPIRATYTITPESGLGCAGQPVPVVITINQEPIPQPVNGPAELCSGDPDNVYSVSPVGGSSYHWTVDAEVGTITFDYNTNAVILDAADEAGSGEITVYETNSLGCSGDISTKTVQVYDRPDPEDISGDNIVCAYSTHTYTVTNRTGSVYNWTVPGGASISGSPSSNSVTVTFGNDGGTILVREINVAGCVTNHNPLAVTVNPLPTATINNGGRMCEGGSRPLNVVFTGTAPFSFTYAINGVTQPVPVTTNLYTYALNATEAGAYTIVNVTDNSECTNVGSGMATVTYYSLPTGIISGTTEICMGSPAVLTMTFTGMSPYTFTYTDGTTPVTVTAHPTNVYTVTVSPAATSTYEFVSVTDYNGCPGVMSGSAVITVNQPPVISFAGTDLTCYNIPTGAIDMTITGGTGPFGISWTGPNGYHASTEDIAGLYYGSYAVVVTDAEGCSTTGNAAITQPPVLNGTIARTDITCHNANNGTIIISGVSGGSGTYEYTIDGGVNWDDAATITGLGPGTYSVQVRDAVNTDCIMPLYPSVTIAEPEAIQAALTSSDVTCFGASDGLISVTNPSGGYGTYLYSINGGDSWQGLGTYSNLAPGIYDVRIRDAFNGDCDEILDEDLEISEPVILTAGITSTNVSCFGGNDGEITISGAAGGYGTYEYSINGGGFWQTSGIFTGLTYGQYNILIRDAAHRNCIEVLNSAYPVTQPDMLFATVAKTDVTCHGNNDGTISITSPMGGYGTYEYSIYGEVGWQASDLFTGLAPGTYDVRIRDRAHTLCSAILNPNLVITEPLTLQMSTTGDMALACYGDNSASGTFFALGGTMPYTFQVVSNTTGGTLAVPGFNSQGFFNAGYGTITIRVIDVNFCSAEATITITRPDQLMPGSIGSDQVICYGTVPDLLTETAAATGGPAPYVYQWQSSLNSSGSFGNIAGAVLADYAPTAGSSYTTYYRRMVTSGYCLPVYSNVVSVTVNPQPVALLSGGETICPGQSSVLNLTMSSGLAPFTVEIENLGTVTGYVSGAGITVTPSETTTYRLLRVVDANNCEVVSPSANLSGSATVSVDALPSILSFTPSPAVCEFSMASFSVIAGGTNLTFQWWVDEGTGFTAIEDGGVYFGSRTNTLQIFNPVRDMDGNIYHVVITGCGQQVISDDAVFNVNTTPEITLHPGNATVCTGGNAIMEAGAVGTEVIWQWFVNRGSGFVPVSDDINFSGSATNTLTITNVTTALNNYIFRAAAMGTCGVPVYTNFAVLRVLSPPTVTVQPNSVTICDNSSTSLFANGINYNSLQWQVNISGTWTDLEDNATYIGASTQQLGIMNATVSMSGYHYRMAMLSACETIYTNEATIIVHDNPVVDFSAIDPVRVCGGVPQVIDGNPAGGSGTYTAHQWTGDVGPLGSYFVQAPVFNSTVTASYALNYRVTDSNGCTGNDDVIVTVDSPSAEFTQDVDYGCLPLAVTFSKDMAGLAKWWWNFGDGSPVDSVNANPVHTYATDVTGSARYFTVSLRVQSVGGCFAEALSTVIAYPEVDATFTPDKAIICSGNSIIFTAVPGATRYFWDFGDNVSGYYPASTSHLYVNQGTEPVVRTVTLTTTSFYDCVNVQTYDITVMPVPYPQFTADPGSQVFDPAGNPVSFTNSTNEGTWNWIWRFGDNSTSAEKDPVHNYTAYSDYLVTLVATNTYCSDSVRHTVYILPPSPVANFDSIPSGCAPLTVVINNTSENTGFEGTTYRWDFGDGSSSTARNPTYTYFTEGSYRIELTVTGPGGTSMKSQVVYAYPSPKAYFEITPATVYANDERIRCFNLSQGANSYLWDFGDGDTSKLQEPYHKYLEEGEYEITLWAYSGNSCSDKYVLSPGVIVEPAGEIRFASVFTPNKTGPVERTDLPTGGTEADQFFYPAIRQKVQKYKLQIFNRWGTLIFESDNINVPWNGYYHGELCQQGVYVWYVEGKFADGKPFKMVGDVTLLQ